MLGLEADTVSSRHWHQHHSQVSNGDGDSSSEDEAGADVARASQDAARQLTLESIRVFYVSGAQTTEQIATLAALQEQGIACSLLPVQRLVGQNTVAFLAWFSVRSLQAESNSSL